MCKFSDMKKRSIIFFNIFNLQVTRAKQLLALLSPSTVQVIRNKQIRNMIAAREIELVKEMVDEGLLGSKFADIFISEIVENRRKETKQATEDSRQIFKC